MTAAAANAVVDRIEADESFAARVKEAGGSEASLAVLRAEGFDVTADDMRDALVDRYGDALTTEQLDAIAAGASQEEEELVTVGIIFGSMAGMMAVAAAGV